MEHTFYRGAGLLNSQIFSFFILSDDGLRFAQGLPTNYLTRVSIGQKESHMKLCHYITGLVVLVVLAACSFEEEDSGSLLISTHDFDFNESDHSWKPGFADFPAGSEDSALFELEFAYTDQPSESKLSKKSLMLSGNNLNEDLFMYVKRKIHGLRPGTEYTVTFNVELASNFNASLDPATTGSVCLKAGATPVEPRSVIDANYFVMNIDKGNRANSGEDMISLGDIRTPQSSSGYALISRNNTMANSRYVSRSSSTGELWLIVGTDSDMTGTTTVFYSRITVVLSAS